MDDSVVLDREDRTSIASGGLVRSSSLVDGVRGQAARVHQSFSDMAEPLDSMAKLYADDLAAHGYQLHERVHSGVACEIYRVSRLPQQRHDVTLSSYSATEAGIRNLPVQAKVKSTIHHEECKWVLIFFYLCRGFMCNCCINCMQQSHMKPRH